MSQPLRLGVAGLGTVGAGLLNLLDEHGERLEQMLGRRIVVEGVSARSRTTDAPTVPRPASPTLSGVAMERPKE